MPSPAARSAAFVTVPVLCAAAALACGIALSREVYRSPAWLAAAAAIGFTTLLACPRTRRPLQICALLLAWMATGWALAETQPLLHLSASLHNAALDGRPHALIARVEQVQTPVEHEGWRGSIVRLQSIEATLRSVDGMQTSARISLTEEATHETAITSLQCGDTVSADALLRLPQKFHTPGAWSPADAFALRDIAIIGIIRPQDVLQVSSVRASLPCRIHNWQRWIFERLQASSPHTPLTADELAVLSAALLGDRELLTPGLRSAFQRTGTYHLLVVSGLSIAVIAALLYLLLRALRINRWAATSVTLTLLTAYALLSGFRTPVQRALLMTAIFMIGRLLYRRLEPLNSLGVAAIVLLAISPRALFDAGFQMTFAAVIAIAGIVGPLLDAGIRPALDATRDLWSRPNDPGLPPRLAQLRVMLRLWSHALRPVLGYWLSNRAPAWLVRLGLRITELFVLSLVLECCLAPFMAVYFHQFTALSVVANAVTLLWMGVVLPLGFGMALAALLWMPAAHALAWPLALVMRFAQAAIAHLSALRLSDVRLPPPRTAALFAISLAWLLAMLLVRFRSRISRAASLLCITAVGALSFWSTPFVTPANTLEVTVLDVGQGDSILVVAPGADGRPHTLLIDAGGAIGSSLTPTAAGERIGEDVVSNYLWQRGIRRLDAVALTHAHEDHMGGMPAVLRNFRPRELWVGNNPGIAPYNALLAQARALGIEVKSWHAGDDVSLGAVQLRVLWPARDYQPGESASNEDSLVLAAQYAGRIALLEGDAQRRSENAMLQSGVPHVDVLKVAHHGSLTSSTPEFLIATSAKFAAISDGRYNSYGHPKPAVLQRLQDAHTLTYRTDEEGTTTFFLDANGVRAQLP